jgi:hypothetical protein
MLTSTQFASLVVACAEGATSADRIAADRELCADIQDRMTAFGLAFQAGDLSASGEIKGGVERARRHFFRGSSTPPSQDFFGPLVPEASPTPPGPSIPPLVPSTKRRWIRVSALPGAPFIQDPIDEWITAPTIVLGVGTYAVQFDGVAWSASTTAGASIALAVAIDGSVVETFTEARPDSGSATPGKRTTVSAGFVISLEVSTPGALTLVNAGAADQTVSGILRAVVPA